MVVLNWNGAEDTCRCLDSIDDSQYPNLRVIVVDNGSRAGQVETIRQRNGDDIDRLIRNEENVGYAAGNNVGIRHAIEDFDCEYVLVLNNDTVVQPDSIGELVRGAQRRSAGIVGPKIRSLEDRSQISEAGGTLYPWIAQHRLRGKGEEDTGQYDEPERVDFVSGACMLVRRDVFESIGLIPTFYFLQWEDIDFCTAADRGGYDIVYWPDAVVYHDTNSSFEREGVTYPMVARGFRNRIWYFRRYSSRMTKLLQFFAVSAVTLPVHFLYYCVFKRDARYLLRVFCGIYLGLINDIGEGPDPDPELNDVAEKAKHTPTCLSSK